MGKGHEAVRAACHSLRDHFRHILSDEADFTPTVLLVRARGQLKERLETTIKRLDIGLQADIR